MSAFGAGLVSAAPLGPAQHGGGINGRAQTSRHTSRRTSGTVSGSNAQRGVFEDILIEAYLRAEQFERAETLLRRRLDRRTSARTCSGWDGRRPAAD